MTSSENKKTISTEKLSKFLRQNKNMNLDTINLTKDDIVSKLNWKGLKNESEEILKQLKGYQRLYRVLEEDNTKLILALLKQNIHSAIQIGAMTQKQFINDYAKTFKNDVECMKRAYQKAGTIRNQLVLRYMEYTQNREAHATQIKTL